MDNPKENQNQNTQNKYDISKSNFFANIPDSNDKKNEKEIKPQVLSNINTPILNQSNFFPNSNFFLRHLFGEVL